MAPYILAVGELPKEKLRFLNDWYDSYINYLNNIIKTDTTKERISVCKNCPIVVFCCGGCKLIPKDARGKTYCKLKKTIFMPILEAVQEIGEELVENNGC